MNRINGGALGARNLQSMLANTYDKKGKNIDGFELDKNLSGKRTKVWYNPETNQSVVGHRGTANAKDWITDARMAYGNETNNRFKHAKKIQKKAEAKYGQENISTIGHSLGGRLAEKYGKNTNEVITVNKAVIPKTMFDKVQSNQYDVRSSRDVVSALPQRNKKLSTIKADSWNPLTEHKTEVLLREPDKVYGKKPLQGSGFYDSEIFMNHDPLVQQRLNDYLNQLRDNGNRYPELYRDLMINRRVMAGNPKSNDLIRYNQLYSDFENNKSKINQSK
jgi:predicted esterase YcpF (UPF0227 family)